MALKSILYSGEKFDISYEILNPQGTQDLIILHGWGSNKGLMKNSFSPFMQDFRHIYIDLPGFGGSSCDMVLHTKDYASIVELFLTKIGVSKDMILGHSFGGKVATLLKPKVLILVGSSGIYMPKPFKIRAKIVIYKMLKIFGLSKFRSFFVADDAKSLSSCMYDTFKNVVDEDFSLEFSSSTSKTLLCWGRDDTATPLSSGEKIDQLIQDSTLRVYDGDHYFFMTHAKEISLEIQNINRN